MKNLFRNFFYRLPPRLRFASRRFLFLPTDLISGRYSKNSPMPPKGMIYTGSGNFIEDGKRFLSLFVSKGGMRPEDHVLDIGSGIGRMALPLTAYLSSNARYEGFDVVQLGVDWCKKHITQKHPNFQFRYLELDNDLYRSTGEQARNLSFPYEDGTFTFAIAISVFTHMLPEETARYFRETARVLQSGGRCFFTFFILEDGRTQADEDFQFAYDKGYYALMSEKVKTANVAYQLEWLEEQWQSAGLRIVEINRGHWTGQSRSNCLDFQDVVVLERG